MIRVLLADDHPVVRTGYRRLLEQAGDVAVVAEAGDGEAAYAAFDAVRPDVLVADLSMPGGGLVLIHRVVRLAPWTGVLVFSMHDGALLVRRAFEAGARGYLTKASAPDELVVAIRAVHAGRRHLDAGLSPTLAQPQPDTRHEAERLASLSAREFEVFRRLAQGQTAADCAQALGLSPKTVANHQTLIREKLGVPSAAALVHLALRHALLPPAAA